MEAIFKQANAVFIQRYATAAEWTANNPIIYPGEIGIESDTSKIKVGGTQPAAWRELDYSSSDGAQVIDNLDTIYEDYTHLPASGYNGQKLIAKTGGAPPLIVYQWFSSERSWVEIDQVKETVVYLAKRKNNLTNILCFYDAISGSFISTEQQKQLVITSIDTIYSSETQLNSNAPKADGNIFVALSSTTSNYCLFKYVAATNAWVQLAAVTDTIIYSNKQASTIYSAPANSLWRVEFSGDYPRFIRVGYDQDIKDQIGDISNALTELHSYAEQLISEGGSA